MLQATFCPLAVSSMPLTRSGAVSKRMADLDAEKVSLSAASVSPCAAPRQRQRRCARRAGSDAVVKASARRLLRLAVQRPQAAREHVAHALLPGSSRRDPSASCARWRTPPAGSGGRWRRCRSCCSLPQCLLPLGAQGIGRLPRFVEEPLALGLRLVRRLAQAVRRAAGRTSSFLSRNSSRSFCASACLRVRVRQLPRRSASPARRWRSGWACRESASATTPG